MQNIWLNEKSKTYGCVNEHIVAYLRHVLRKPENLSSELIVLLILEKKLSVTFMKSAKFSLHMEQMQNTLVLLKQDKKMAKFI